MSSWKLYVEITHCYLILFFTERSFMNHHYHNITMQFNVFIGGPKHSIRFTILMGKKFNQWCKVSTATQIKFCLQHSRNIIWHLCVTEDIFYHNSLFRIGNSSTSTLTWIEFQGFWLQLAFIDKTNAFF